MNTKKFKELYDFCQTLTPKVSRKTLVPKVKELTGTGNLRILKTNLDISVIRGFFLHATNTEHPLVKESGFNVIVLARELPNNGKKCWERFVVTKEVMHLFDDSDDITDTDEKFAGLLESFGTPIPSPAPQKVSDYKGIWMALACLCPEKNRLEFQALLEKNQIDHYGIALQLRIPEQYVPLLFRSDYLELINILIK
jgi:hypothetical protein